MRGVINDGAVDVARVRAMRERGVSWTAIGKTLGLSTEFIRRRVEPGWGERRDAKIRDARARRSTGMASGVNTIHTDRGPKVPAAEIERLRRAELPDTRDLTARLLGDPPPGRSALDRHRASTPQEQA